MDSFNKKFNELNNKIYHALNMDGKTGEIIEVMNYNIKKGLIWTTKELGETLQAHGLKIGDPYSVGIGTMINNNIDGFRDVMMEKNNMEYLDKKIREECKNRFRPKEYYTLSDDDKKIADALWRRDKWRRENLNDKRIQMGIDRTIDWAEKALEQRKNSKIYQFCQKYHSPEHTKEMDKKSFKKFVSEQVYKRSPLGRFGKELEERSKKSKTVPDLSRGM